MSCTEIDFSGLQSQESCFVSLDSQPFCRHVWWVSETAKRIQALLLPHTHPAPFPHLDVEEWAAPPASSQNRGIFCSFSSAPNLATLALNLSNPCCLKDG